MRKPALLLATIAVGVTPGVLPAQSSARYLNPQDVAEAQRQHPELLAEYGGAETGRRAAYVQSVGQRVASYSGVQDPGQAFHFTMLNSAVENAFAVPGGYIYITRQLMTLMDNEAELAFALGHETGHVAANHAHAREAYASRSTILGVLGAVLGSVFGNGVFGDVISQRAQRSALLSTLSFSRQQEYQADTLGTRYLVRAGYDPEGGPGILAALTRASALQARLQGRTNRQTPEWASTHPLSENRMQRALADARGTGRLGNGLRNRDQFLAQLNGLYVEDDPAQGIIEGRTFTHPDLRIQFAVPVGYLMQNGTRAVSIRGSAGQGQFGGGRFTGSLENYVYRVFEELTGGRQQINIPPPRRTVINGMPAVIAATRASSSSGGVDVSVVAYQWDPGNVYHFIMLTRAGAGIGPFGPMVQSLRRITPGEAAAIRPRVIEVVSVRPNDTIQSLASRMAYRDFQVDRFLALNGIARGGRLTPGQKVKLVVFGARRG